MTPSGLAEYVNSTLRAEPARVAKRASSGERTNGVLFNIHPIAVFVGALVLTYGYETFSFNLTIDEEVVGGLGNVAYAQQWVAQGRWSMGMLTLLLPTAVVPVVSTGLGVALSGVAWWQLCRRHFSMTGWQSALAASLAGTVPVLAFLFSFSTIAFGIGVGNLLLVVFFWGLCADSWKHRALAAVAGAAAIGIYDTFLAALGALSLAYIFKRGRPFAVAVGAVLPVVSYVLSKFAGWLAGLATGTPLNSYLSRYMDLQGLMEDPFGRLAVAVENTLKTFLLSTSKFGLHSPWLAIVLLVLSLVAVIGIITSAQSTGERVIRWSALTALYLIPLGAELVSNGPVMLRSMIYIPVVILVLSFMSRSGLTIPASALVRKLGHSLIACLIILAVLGHSAIANRMFSSAATMYALDQDLAFTIGQEKDRLTHGDQWTSLPLAVSGMHSWPFGSLTVTRENLGSSFFKWDGGSPHRISAFLRSQGVLVHAASAEQTSRAWDNLATMPQYPQPGWIALTDGVLLLNFGERTVYQQD